MTYFKALIPIALLCMSTSGRSDDFKIPLRLSWATPLYKQELLSTDFIPEEGSSPIVVKDTVFVGGSGNIFMSINARTGKIIWVYNTLGPVRSRPAYDNGMVYFGSSDGFFYALKSSSGNLKWKYKISSEVLSQPVISKGMVYINAQNNTIYALDQKSGNWVWQYSREMSNKKIIIRSSTSPVIDGLRLFMGFPDGNLISLDSSSGKEIWSISLGSGKRFNDIISTPVIEGDLMYISSFDDQTYCMDKFKGEARWTYSEGSHRTGALGDSEFVISTSNGEVVSLNKDTGLKNWVYTIKNELLSQPVIAGDKVIIGSDKAPLYILSLKKGKLLWKFRQSEGLSGVPVVDGNNLYFLSNGGVVYRFSPSIYAE